MNARACGGVWLILAALGMAEVSGAEIRSVQEAYAALQTGLQGDQAQAVEQFVRRRYKDQKLQSGGHRHLSQPVESGGGYVLWALEAGPDADPVVVAEKQRRWPMQRLGDSNLWVAAEKFPNFSSAHYRFDVGDRRLGGSERVGFESYEWLPESLEQPGVPKGELIEMGKHVSQLHFPGAVRQWWIYVPAQYDRSAANETRLIVFNDGGGFIRGEGNACTLLDNLIHQKKIPVTLAVFANPGEFAPGWPDKPSGSNRSNEYDTCTPRFATFLDEELLPIVRERYPHSSRPEHHAICGSSSGGSCAFTAAWHRPDLFGRVISFVGSFCDFRPTQSYPEYRKGFELDIDEFSQWKTAHDYPALIRKTEPRKPLKVFLQDGENDLDNKLGNWFLNNLRMAAALEYAGYEFKFVAGKGIHSKKHGMAILPEILVWIWSDTPREESAGVR